MDHVILDVELDWSERPVDHGVNGINYNIITFCIYQCIHDFNTFMLEILACIPLTVNDCNAQKYM